jgi:hypothetical protein
MVEKALSRKMRKQRRKSMRSRSGERVMLEPEDILKEYRQRRGSRSGGNRKQKRRTRASKRHQRRMRSRQAHRRSKALHKRGSPVAIDIDFPVPRSSPEELRRGSPVKLDIDLPVPRSPRLREMRGSPVFLDIGGVEKHEEEEDLSKDAALVKSLIGTMRKNMTSTELERDARILYNLILNQGFTHEDMVSQFISHPKEWIIMSNGGDTDFEDFLFDLFEGNRNLRNAMKKVVRMKA